MSIVNFFIPSNIGKSLDTMPCEGDLCIVIQLQELHTTFYCIDFCSPKQVPTISNVSLCQ